MGLKTGTKVEIFSAFEFSNQSPEPDKIDLDIQYIDTRRDLATQLFPKLDIIGFFSTNDSITPNEKDREILKAMTYFGVITPVYLVLSTNVEKASELPIGVYDIDKTKKTFNKVNHVIEGWESERICLETVTKTAEIGNDQSGLIQNLQTTKNALNVLKENLDLIKNNMKKFEKDEKFKELFTSSAYQKYLTSMAKAATGRYRQGLQALMEWDARADAGIAHTDNYKIHINAANEITQSFPSRYLRSESLVGFNGHETAHLLFSDFTALGLYLGNIEKGAFYPSNPSFTELSYQTNCEEILEAMDIKDKATCLTLASPQTPMKTQR